jgi:amidase
LTALATATAQLAALAAGRTSSVELLQECLARIAALNPAINAVVALDTGGALAAARAADQARQAGAAVGPLAGLPLTIKDAIDVAGLPTACGDPARAAAVATADAVAVGRLRAAGAIPFGKTNVPLNAADFQTFNALHGTTRNPYALDRTPGGSSGGAAAAVAAGLAPVELGTDLAGSLRIPATACGVASLKPSFGLVPVGGVYAGLPGQRRSSDLLVVGPMARSVADLRLLFDVLAGPAPAEAPAWRLVLPGPPPGFRPRIALWLEDPFCPPEPAVVAAITAAARAIGDRVAVVVPGRPPWPAEDFFGMHCTLMYGELALAAPTGTFDYFVRRSARTPPGEPFTDSTALLAAGLTVRHRDWLAAGEQREAFRAVIADYFAGFDAIICPAAPAPAALLDERRLDRRTEALGGQSVPALTHTYWAAIASSLYLPAVTVPVGQSRDGLPIGAQVIAPYLHDHVALAVAELLEQGSGGFRAPPLADGRFRPTARSVA